MLLETNSFKPFKWYFAPSEGSLEKGPNDAHMETIPGNPWKGLVRESVQNSMDAARDGISPVVVKFKIGQFELEQMGEFNKLQEHIRACKEYFPQNNKASEKFSEMENLFNRNNFCIPYLEISDFNTTGMAYEDGNTNCPFYGFVRSAGVSVKSVGKTGGSFGFGKSAYFKISPLRTVLVSTLTETGVPVFEGISWLCTHKYEGIKVSDAGFFDNNDGQPSIGTAQIPHFLRRNEIGTSFYIMGFAPEKPEKMKKEMIQEALRNFWLALYEGKLELEINNDRLDKNNLEAMLQKFFPEEIDTKSGTNTYNPKPYFYMIKNYGQDEKIKKIVKEIACLGKVTLYLARMQTPRDKVLFMRRPKMLVYAKTPGTSYGVYGLFICDNEQGDKLLRKMENPAHDEWKASNYRTSNNNLVSKGVEAEKALKEFIQESISSEFGIKDSDNLEITGLDELLYIPEDLLGKEQKRAEGVNLNSKSNTIPRPKIDIKHQTAFGSVLITHPGSHDYTKPSDDVTTPMGTNHGKLKRSAKGTRSGQGNNFHDSDPNDDNGEYKTPIPVTFRVFAQKIGETLWHKLIIYSPQDITEGEIELLIPGDDGNDELNIYSALKGQICGNRITKISLKTGKNEIPMRFQDNQKHSIRLKAYAVK